MPSALGSFNCSTVVQVAFLLTGVDYRLSKIRSNCFSLVVLLLLTCPVLISYTPDTVNLELLHNQKQIFFYLIHYFNFLLQLATMPCIQEALNVCLLFDWKWKNISLFLEIGFSLPRDQGSRDPHSRHTPPGESRRNAYLVSDACCLPAPTVASLSAPMHSKTQILFIPFIWKTADKMELESSQQALCNNLILTPLFTGSIPLHVCM